MGKRIRIGTAIGAALLLASCTGAQKADAMAACEEVALLRGEGSEFTDTEIDHVSANLYVVTGTVVTPGLPDEDFKGYADIDDGEYTCRVG